MSDFSPSGLYGLAPTTADSLRLGGNPAVLGWITEAVQEGDLINRQDPAFDMADKGMRYIIGEQKDAAQLVLQYLPFAVINKSRKSVQAHVSALTDIKPVFGYKALNPLFTFHGDLLNKLTVAWWMDAMADVTLGDCIKYALAGGTGDLAVEWDPGACYGTGDHKIIAKDFRDTLAIRPGTDPNPQTWQGVVFREAYSINAMRDKYPSYAGAFKPATDTLLSTIMSKFRHAVAKLQTPMADTLSGLASVPAARAVRPGDLVVYRTILNDKTRNLTNKPIPMGDPTANWAYVVEPGAPLYPQKRMIIATPDLILYDGPNPFWHSMYPFARLKLWSVPWCFLGLSLLHDTIPLQDAINDSMKDLRLGIKQWTNPDTQYDKNSVSRAFQTAFDPQRPGKKIGLNLLGSPSREPYKKMEGPNPQVLTLLLETYRQLCVEHDEQTGVANLQQLLQMRGQLPSEGTLEAYYQAMTPELRQEGRAIEAFLRDVAQMHKFNIFQFQTSLRRRNILGDAALALEDFDFDPDTLVPAMDQNTMTPDPATGLPIPQPTPGYTPELDRSKSRTQRAKAFAKMFIFTVAPNSILALNAQENRMMAFQLARMGYLDYWSLLEKLEVPNVGNPPAMPLPPLQPPTDPVQIQQGLASGQYVPNPQNPLQVLEMRVPMTVTERLMAQQLLGIGMTTDPAGRKASGNAPPAMEQKKNDDGTTRQTITESDK